MNIIFLTMSRIYNLQQNGIYPDLLRVFVANGHNVAVVAPAERMLNEETNYNQYDGYSVLRVKVGNLQKTNVIEKGISTILLEGQFMSAIKKYYKDTKFDLVMYSTPPITFAKVIDFLKRRDDAQSYLLLKDIFPQNAVDLGMFSKKSVFYKYFRNKEKQLYKQSDYIGCMSEANVQYVIKHNPQINPEIVHVSPNSVEPVEIEKNPQIRVAVRKKYGIPNESTVFIYGGNLGKPQGIPFVIECLRANADKKDRFFVVSGMGTEYTKLKMYMDTENPSNVLLINGLPKQEYDELVSVCDVGLIFLDYRFTIPNFPSRLLAYMQNSMPVIACTDKNSDVGDVVEKGGFGWKCISDNVENFTRTLEKAINGELLSIGERARDVLLEKYTVKNSYETIIKRLEG